MLPTQSDANEMLREDQRRRRQETTMTGMTRDEALVRAREAWIAGEPAMWLPEDVRNGRADGSFVVQRIIRALLDAHKPLSEIVPQPAVDPDMLLAREIMAAAAEADDRADAGAKVRAGGYDDHCQTIAVLRVIRNARKGAA